MLNFCDFIQVFVFTRNHHLKLDMTLAPFLFDTNNICSAVFALTINRLHSFKRQPFWFHNLNSMVPVKGIVLFN